MFPMRERRRSECSTVFFLLFGKQFTVYLTGKPIMYPFSSIEGSRSWLRRLMKRFFCHILVWGVPVVVLPPPEQILRCALGQSSWLETRGYPRPCSGEGWKRTGRINFNPPFYTALPAPQTPPSAHLQGHRWRVQIGRRQDLPLRVRS